jgi:hypothetical protein
MSVRRFLSSAVVLLALITLLGLAPTAWAQEVTASIVGTVTDPSGAPINGANVTATDSDRGTVWSAKSNEAGTFNITRLPVGSYSVKIAAQGFQTATYPAFTLVLNQTARVDLQMKVGQASETVEVTGTVPVLQTESTEVSTLIDANTVTSLPLAARNYVQLTLLSPGATNVNPESMQLPQNQLTAGRPYINGNREQANLFLLDGQANSEKQNDEIGYTPGVDAIQEFNIITQNASAEFGNYEGGVINATVKSGTNSFHGDVFEFLRNDALNANKYFSGMSRGIPILEGAPGHASDGTVLKPKFRYNQFGGTFGGPIIKNKLFFFADYQGQRLENVGATGVQLLTQRERAGDYSQLCLGGFSGGVCNDRDASGLIALNQLVVPNSGGPTTANCAASATTYYLNPAQRPACGGANPIAIGSNNLISAGFTINPVAANLFGSKVYPLPQLDSVSGNNYFFNSGTTLNNDQGDLKVDYNASDKDHVFVRWSQMHLRNPAFTGLPIANAGGGPAIDTPIRNAVVNWNRTLTSHLLNEVRVGFVAVRYDQKGTTTDVLGNFGEQLGITGSNPAPGLLLINIAGSGTQPSANLGLIGALQIFHTTQGQFDDNLIYTHGRHTIKGGFQYFRDRQDYDYGGNNGELGQISIASLTGASVADLWLGNISAGGVRDGNSNTIFMRRSNTFGAYVQDDWRVTNTLTLNAGVRFDDHTPGYEVHNQEVNFNIATGAIELPGQNGNSRALYNNYLGIGDWQPRIGLSWSPAALGGKTVIRAGYGISSYLEGGGENQALTQNPPFFGATENANAGNIANAWTGAASIPPCTAIDFSCYAGKTIRITDPNFRPASSQQWNLTIQHQFNNTTTFQIGYVGQHGTHLLQLTQMAQLIGLNAAGQIAQPGQLIVKTVAGPFLGGGAPGTLYSAELGHLARAATSNSSQSYNSLQAVLQKRMGSGLEAQVAYTYSKCLSNSPGYFGGGGWGSDNTQTYYGQPGFQNIYDPRSDWGPCFYDQTHILSSYVTYQLPIGRGKQFGRDLNPAVNAVVGNWEIGGIIAVHSGNALTMNQIAGWGDTTSTNGIGYLIGSARPNCNGPIHVIDKLVPGNAATNTPGFIQWFDPSNISDTSAATPMFGTCSVGNFRGPGLQDVDLSLHKQFLITEGKSLEFRLEAVNAFNHRVLTFRGGPSNGSFEPSSESSFAGQVTGSQSARNVQLGLKFLF